MENYESASEQGTHEQIEEATQYVTFNLADEMFGVLMDVVLEIIRPPETIDVPLTPGSLVGLANLRGSILPILDLRSVLGMSVENNHESTRVIIVDVGTVVGFVVDRIHRVIDVVDRDIAPAAVLNSNVSSELISGVIKNKAKEPLIQLLNVQCLVEYEFAEVLTPSRLLVNLSVEQSGDDLAQDIEELDDSKQLVSFLIDQQEYAFDLTDVQEIVRIPDDIAKVPKTDDYVIGIIRLRERLLPLVSLRQLFSMQVSKITEQHRIVVVNVADKCNKVNCIGLVVDQVREVLRVNEENQDSVPALLNLGGESDEISRVCRLENGNRLVSILKADALISHPCVQAALEENEVGEGDSQVDIDQQAHDLEDEDSVQLVIFQLNGQEYGVSIEYVQEITRLPEKMDKVPKTPEFVEGMVNMRGTVLPVMDMRTRFDLQKMPTNDRQRIVVLNVDGTRTGFIVDLVSEVLRISRAQIERSPSLSTDQARVMGEVVNLREVKRMIQVLTVDELLSEQEMTAISGETVA